MAPGMIAPVVSFTVPVTVPPFGDGRAGLGACARADTAVRQSRANVRMRDLRTTLSWRKRMSYGYTSVAALRGADHIMSSAWALADHKKRWSAPLKTVR